MLYRWNQMVPLSQHHRRVLLCHPANSAAWLYLVLRVHWDVWYMIIPDTFYSLPCHVMAISDCVSVSYPLCLCLFAYAYVLSLQQKEWPCDGWLGGLVWITVATLSKSKMLHTQTAIGLPLNKLKQRVQCDSMIIYWFADEPKFKQTIEKLVSICRTVGMQTFYEGVCCTYIYIYNICKVKLLSFSNWPIMWLNFVSMRLKLAANGCFSDKASMICTPHCLFAD